MGELAMLGAYIKNPYVMGLVIVLFLVGKYFGPSLMESIKERNMDRKIEKMRK